MKRIILAACVALLAGCVPQHWTKPGGTAEQFEQDKAQCMYESDLHTQGAGANPFAALQLVPECLKAKGYTGS